MTIKEIAQQPRTTVPVHLAIEARHVRGEISRGNFIYQAHNAWQIWEGTTPATRAAFSAVYLAKPTAGLLDEYLALVEGQKAS